MFAGVPPRRDGPLRALAHGVATGALLGGASLAPTLGPLAFVALVPLLRFLFRRHALKLDALAGAAAGAAFVAVAGAWVPALPESSKVVGAAYLLIIAFGAIWFAAFGLLVGVARRFGARTALLATPLFWLVVELGRSTEPFGTAWLQLGSLIAGYAALIQIAFLGGVPLLSFWLASANSAIAGAGSIPSSARAGCALALTAPLFWGVLALEPPVGLDRGSIRIAAVQPNVVAADRYRPASFTQNLSALIALSHRSLRERPDLVVWPESAFERPLAGPGDAFLTAAVHGFGVPLLTGARRPANGSTFYNSAIWVEPNGNVLAISDKLRPVPVYERAPLTTLEARLASWGFWPGRVQPGRSPGIVEVARRDGGTERLGVIVCGDASDPAVARGLRNRGATALLILANEAETGPLTAHQMVSLARLRAVENRLPVARIANTGPSVIVDGWGRLRQRVDGGRAASLVGAIPTERPHRGRELRNGPALATLLLLPLALRRTHAVAPRTRNPMEGPT